MTPDEMRARAKELVVNAQKRLAEGNLTPAEQVQVSVITDQVNAFTLVAFADYAESNDPDARKAKAKKILDYNDQIRKAAAMGFSKNDWSAFDKLVDAGLPGGADGDASANGGT